ncbi:MAG: RhuM family protein [Haliea sp.]
MSDLQVQIFTSQDGSAQLEVALERDTAWLSLDQMTALFERDKSVISRHLRNVFNEGELQREAVVAKNATTAADGKTYQIDYYNLDVIISVGYRVKSQRGVQFRQWATRVLKNHLVQGYTLNQRRLAERGIEFEQALDLLSRTLTSQGLVSAEGEAVARVISDYARSWSLLQGYDEQQLADGNKRCGSFLFLWYLRRNQALLAKPVEQLINDNTLVALALLVAESLPERADVRWPPPTSL